MVCTTPNEILDILEKMDNDPCAQLLRIKPRVGPPKNLNDLILNFEYMEVCICELQIKFGGGATPLAY